MVTIIMAGPDSYFDRKNAVICTLVFFKQRIAPIAKNSIQRDILATN